MQQIPRQFGRVLRANLSKLVLSDCKKYVVQITNTIPHLWWKVTDEFPNTFLKQLEIHYHQILEIQINQTLKPHEFYNLLSLTLYLSFSPYTLINKMNPKKHKQPSNPFNKKTPPPFSKKTNNQKKIYLSNNNMIMCMCGEKNPNCESEKRNSKILLWKFPSLSFKLSINNKKHNLCN